jgi:hypothetical protein
MSTSHKIQNNQEFFAMTEQQHLAHFNTFQTFFKKVQKFSKIFKKVLAFFSNFEDNSFYSSEVNSVNRQ